MKTKAVLILITLLFVNVIGCIDNISYTIYTDDTKTYARNEQGFNAFGVDKIDFSGTDAGTVIQNTINSMTSGGTVLIKSGTYKINKQEPIVTDNITVLGEGQGATLLDFTTNGQLLIEGRKNIAFKKLAFRSDINVGMDRIKFSNTNGILFENVKTIGGGKDWTNFMVHFNSGNNNIIITNVEATGSIDSPFRFYKTNIGLFVNNYYAHDLVSCNCGDGMDIFGVRNAKIMNFHAANIPGNGIGIYADAKNINIDNIYSENVGYGTGNSHIGKGISIVRWDGKDPADIRINNFRVVNSNGHGLQIRTKASSSSNSTTSGTINNITITNFQSTGTWWSGLTFEGGNINNVIVNGFTIAQADMSKTGSPPIYFNAQHNNVRLSNGILVPPYTAFNTPTGVTIENVQ